MQKKQAIDEAVEHIYKQDRIPGLAIQASKQGKIIYENYLGYQDVAKEKAVTADTIFGVASLTKSMTAFAILLLEEAGKLSVDDDVVEWLPNLKAVQEGTKIHHLLTHTAGYPGLMSFHEARYPSMRQDEHGSYLFEALPESTGDPVITVEDMIRDMNERIFSFIAAPGELFNYSNESYALLQGIIEKASGESYTSFMKNRVFNALDMQHAYFRLEDIKDSNQLTELYAYTKDDERAVFHSPAWWASGEIYAAGALKTSVRDMMQYAIMLSNRGKVDEHPILSDTSMDKMFSSHIRTPHALQYGYGLLVGEVNGRKLIGHGGGIKGIASFMLVDEEDDIAITVLSNIADAPTEKISMTVWEQLVNLTMNTEVSREKTLLERNYEGKYVSGEGQTSIVRQNKDSIEVEIGHELVKAEAVGTHLFQLADGKKIAFVLDESETVIGMYRGMRYLQKIEQ